MDRVPEELQLTAFGPNMTNSKLRDVHESEGADMAAQVLASLHYPQREAARIAEIISRHDSRTDADSLEEAIVKDSVKLWRYSREAADINGVRFAMT